jgi:hypothetical protein
MSQVNFRLSVVSLPTCIHLYSRLEDSRDAPAVAPAVAAGRSGAGMGVAAAASRGVVHGSETGVTKPASSSSACTPQQISTGGELALAIVKKLGLVLGVAWRTLHDAAKASAPDTGSPWRVKTAASNTGGEQANKVDES